MAIPFALLVALIAGQDSAAPPEFKEVRERIQEAVRAGQAPSLALAVVRDAKVVWAEGFGVADLESKTPATADSVYLLASVSKPLTATGLMVLKDRGLVDLDAPANRYLGEAKLRAFVGTADEMTLRRLANHTAGMPLHWNFFYEGTSPPSMDETIRRYGFAAWAPGDEWAYSNLAFGILDYVTERVSKSPWREFMGKNVYDPLKMTRTSDRVRPGLEPHATAQYDPDKAGRFVRVRPYRFDHAGASAVWSSANDLARFMIAHLQDGAIDGVRVLSEESTREMRKQTSRRADGGGSGVGWAVGPFAGQPSFSHGGGMPGVTTFVAGFPDGKNALIVLSNRSGAAIVHDVARRLGRILYPDPRPDPASPRPSADKKEGSVAGTWKGKVAHFAGDIPLALTIAEGGQATAQWKERPAALRQPSIRPGHFSAEIEGDLSTGTGFAGTPALRLQLRREGERLTGVLMAQAPSNFCLSSWVELRRSGD